MTELQELQARQELKALVDNYAAESDTDNQDYYVNVFTPDCHVQVYFGEKLGMDIHNVKDLIAQFKGFGAPEVSFHMNGQQIVNFEDDSHASGTCYALAHLVTTENGVKTLTTHGVRYYYKYIRSDAGWRISDREQHFVFTNTAAI